MNVTNNNMTEDLDMRDDDEPIQHSDPKVQAVLEEIDKRISRFSQEAKEYAETCGVKLDVLVSVRIQP